MLAIAENPAKISELKGRLANGHGSAYAILLSTMLAVKNELAAEIDLISSSESDEDAVEAARRVMQLATVRTDHWPQIVGLCLLVANTVQFVLNEYDESHFLA